MVAHHCYGVTMLFLPSAFRELWSQTQSHLASANTDEEMPAGWGYLPVPNEFQGLCFSPVNDSWVLDLWRKCWLTYKSATWQHSLEQRTQGRVVSVGVVRAELPLDKMNKQSRTEKNPSLSRGEMQYLDSYAMSCKCLPHSHGEGRDPLSWPRTTYSMLAIHVPKLPFCHPLCTWCLLSVLEHASFFLHAWPNDLAGALWPRQTIASHPAISLTFQMEVKSFSHPSQLSITCCRVAIYILFSCHPFLPL